MRSLLLLDRHRPPPCLALPLALTMALVIGPLTCPAWCQGAPARSARPTQVAQPAAGGAPVGVVDEERLARTRTDFPVLALRVLPQVAAKRKLSLIVTTRGLWWGGAKTTRLDVTSDVLALLRNTPVTPGALTGAQLEAARRVLNELNALRVVTALGDVTRADFNTRLANATIAFDAGMRQLPDGPLKAQLSQAMGGYTRSRDLWEVCAKVAVLTQRRLDAEHEMESYKTEPRLRVQLEPKHEAESEQGRQKSYQPLFDEWRKVGQEVERANVMMPPAVPVMPQ